MATSYSKSLVHEIHASGAETATTQSAGLCLESYQEALIYLKVTAATGTTPTLDVKVQTSHDGSDWYDMGSSFTQITAAATPAVLKITNFGPFIRLVYTIGGTDPSFTFVARVAAKTLG